MKNLLIALFLLLPFSYALPQIRMGHPSPKHEVRAVWLTTIGGLDWPNNYARSPEGIARQKSDLCNILDRLKEARINTVLLQARVRATAIYPSRIEPWDGSMSGIPGVSPGYDPLAFAIDECHKRGMEIHAWLVAFPAHKVAQSKLLGKEAINLRRPDISKRAGDMWMLDPGVPQTAEYLANLSAEIVERYDVDGIHLDYIRYPEKEIEFSDAATYKKYGSGRNKAEWRRQNVTRSVRAIHDAVKSRKPWVKMSCSPVGKHSDLTRFSSRGWNARDAVSQDAQAWLREGLMDMLFPMMYFQGDHFFPFALDWAEESKGRPIVPGLGIYFLSEKEKDWDLSVIVREMNFLRMYGIGGQGFFRSRFLTDNVKGIYDFVKNDYYTSPALSPPMVWLDSLAPTLPAQPRLASSGEATVLSWRASSDNLAACRPLYNVYRSFVYPVDTSNPAYLIGVRISDTCVVVPRLGAAHRSPYYAVTAIDRFGNESSPVEFNVPSKELATRQLRISGASLRVPPAQAEFLMIVDKVGQSVSTVRYAESISVAHLSPGVYALRTLNADGRSEFLGSFVVGGERKKAYR